jgi:GNAT superfamily N-acetyltransferase
VSLAGVFSLTILLKLAFSQAWAFSNREFSMCPSSPNAARIRAANKADLDDITQLALVGFPDDPEVDYRFPHRRQYLRDYRRGLRQEYENYLDQREKFVLYLAEVSVEAAGGVTEWKTAAVAVWDVAPMVKDKTPGTVLGLAIQESRCLMYIDDGLVERRDVNRAHYLEYAAAVARCFNQYFAHSGNCQFHLWLLVTHPRFRRRGLATLLTTWGLGQARSRNWPVTVFASPMGQLLYHRLGFKSIAIEHVQVEGEEDQLTFAVMEHSGRGSSVET